MGGLMDQEGMKVAEFGKALGHCLKLQSLDIGGNTHMTDEFINHLTTQIITIDGQAQKPGMAELVTAKLNFLTNISDQGVQKICNTSQKLEHLELTGVEKLTEYFVETMFKTYTNL